MAAKSAILGMNLGMMPPPGRISGASRRATVRRPPRASASPGFRGHSDPTVSGVGTGVPKGAAHRLKASASDSIVQYSDGAADEKARNLHGLVGRAQGELERLRIEREQEISTLTQRAEQAEFQAHRAELHRKEAEETLTDLRSSMDKEIRALREERDAAHQKAAAPQAGPAAAAGEALAAARRAAEGAQAQVADLQRELKAAREASAAVGASESEVEGLRAALADARRGAEQAHGLQDQVEALRRKLAEQREEAEAAQRDASVQIATLEQERATARRQQDIALAAKDRELDQLQRSLVEADKENKEVRAELLGLVTSAVDNARQAQEEAVASAAAEASEDARVAREGLEAALAALDALQLERDELVVALEEEKSRAAIGTGSKHELADLLEAQRAQHAELAETMTAMLAAEREGSSDRDDLAEALAAAEGNTSDAALERVEELEVALAAAEARLEEERRRADGLEGQLRLEVARNQPDVMPGLAFNFKAPVPHRARPRAERNRRPEKGNVVEFSAMSISERATAWLEANQAGGK